MGAEAAVDVFLQQEYKQWDKAHAKMKDSPPADGHDYLKHAKNLLVLLEGVAELHPIAKAVVASFKTAVMFEQDRRENDARVTAVFLAQTDVMRVLLDINDLANRRRHRPDTEVLRSSVNLDEILLAIQKEIKSCGNSIYTYHKESRFVKFWKAQDWKNRMLGHINRFSKFRFELHQTLSIQVASGVEDIAYKMDAVLSRLYAPKYDWEKNLDMSTRGPEFSDLSWLKTQDTLQTLLRNTNDPSLFIMAPAGSTSQDISMQMTSNMQLSKVQEEIETSLDALCEKNMDMFELILSFHVQQIEQTIVNSAHLVIRSLSGPSDRLVNEDLRQLWKEMDWIFCVENKFFVSALFEFYLDRFSSHNLHKFHHPDNETDVALLEESREESLLRLLSSVVSAPKFSFLSRLGVINHPDAWTLEYIALHGHHITRAIDNDCSGYIRISEANSFTHQIPKGWTLPQWCAYSVAGWAYEARIYRRRICKIMTILTDMQPKVLASNRSYLTLFVFMHFYMTYHGFTREPTGQNIPPPTLELRELVKQKIITQDIVYRGHLQTLRWTVDDESTLHLLYGEMAPEKYMLQFSALVLEHFVAVTELCRSVTIDAKDWLRLSSAFRVIREVSVKRVLELQTRFEHENSESENIATYYGGIWSFVRLHLDTIDDDVTPYTAEELADYLGDLPLLDDFPIPNDASTYLQYSTWEEYLKTADSAEVFSVIPKTWNPIDNSTLPILAERTYMEDFPMTGWKCDRCERTPAEQKRYRCLDIKCPDFDLCLECYSLPQSEHSAISHEFDHHVMLCALYLMPDQEQRIALEAGLALEQLQQEINAFKRSQSIADDPDIVDMGEIQTDSQEAVEATETGKDFSETTSISDGQGPTLYYNTADAVQEAQKQEEVVNLSPGAEYLSTHNESVSTGETQLKTSEEKDTLGLEGGSTETKVTANDINLATDEAVSPVGSDALQLLVTETSEGEASAEPISPSLSRKIFICGRCSVTISPGNDFFRCVGHACRDCFVCSKCAFERFEDDNDAAHQWWHSLFLLREDLVVKQSDQPLEAVSSNIAQDVALLEVADVEVNAESINRRISKLEENF